MIPRSAIVRRVQWAYHVGMTHTPTDLTFTAWRNGSIEYSLAGLDGPAGHVSFSTATPGDDTRGWSVLIGLDPVSHQSTAEIHFQGEGTTAELQASALLAYRTWLAENYD